MCAFHGLIASEDRSLLLLPKSYFGDISPAKRASILRVAPMKALVTGSPKTSLVSQSGDSFSTEGHCPNHPQSPLLLILIAYRFVIHLCLYSLVVN